MTDDIQDLRTNTVNIPLNIGTDATLSATLPEVLLNPARHLATGTDPDLGLGRLLPRGTGRAVTGAAFVILLVKGRLTLAGAGEDAGLIAGQVAVRVNAGVALSWEADDACEIVVISHLAIAGEDALSRVDLRSAMSPSVSPQASVLLSEAPQCRNAVLRDASGLTYGLWEATPYARRGVVMAFSEVMYLLEGSVTLSTPDGRAFTFAAGDVLLAPEGAELAWESPKTVQKFYLSVSR
ncbi:MAG TPA: cupin domain-containing protein [Thermoflexales bacterium]|nr:cupin domain-containing protein [Thermoflexales bacterium]